MPRKRHADWRFFGRSDPEIDSKCGTLLAQRKIASEGLLRFGGACMKQDSKVGCQWPALEVGSARPLTIPTQTRLAAASPFHGCLVSPGSKRGYLLLPPEPCRQMEFLYICKAHSVTAVTPVCGFFRPEPAPHFLALKNCVPRTLTKAACRLKIGIQFNKSKGLS